MKRSIVIISLFISFFISTGCDDTPESQNNIISILIDRSEQGSYSPSGESILSVLPKGNLSDGLELSLTNICDTQFNTKQSFVLEKSETGWLANDDKRRKQYKQLSKQFSDTLFNNNKKQYTFQRSDIFRTLAKELDFLSTRQGNREIWLYSDLKEHSFYNVYDTASEFKLFHSPKLVAKEFEEATRLTSNLSGITLRVIYQPTLEDAELFSKLLELYRMILEPKGVIVKIGIDKKVRL